MDKFKNYFLKPGYIFITEEPYICETILGSCVSVCIWDRVSHIGGMNHHIYATKINNEKNGKIGEYAVEYMIRLMIKAGANPKNMSAKIAGGASNPQIDSDIGENNVKIAKRILHRHKIEIVYESTGGKRGRKIAFNTKTGEIKVRLIEDSSGF